MSAFDVFYDKVYAFQRKNASILAVFFSGMALFCVLMSIAMLTAGVPMLSLSFVLLMIVHVQSAVSYMRLHSKASRQSNDLAG